MGGKGRVFYVYMFYFKPSQVSVDPHTTALENTQPLAKDIFMVMWNKCVRNHLVMILHVYA